MTRHRGEERQTTLVAGIGGQRRKIDYAELKFFLLCVLWTNGDRAWGRSLLLARLWWHCQAWLNYDSIGVHQECPANFTMRKTIFLPAYANRVRRKSLHLGGTGSKHSTFSSSLKGCVYFDICLCDELGFNVKNDLLPVASFFFASFNRLFSRQFQYRSALYLIPLNVELMT